MSNRNPYVSVNDADKMTLRLKPTVMQPAGSPMKEDLVYSSSQKQQKKWVEDQFRDLE